MMLINYEETKNLNQRIFIHQVFNMLSGENLVTPKLVILMFFVSGTEIFYGRL